MFFFPPPNNLLKKPKNNGFASPSCGIVRRRITATDNVKVLIFSTEETFDDSLLFLSVGYYNMNLTSNNNSIVIQLMIILFGFEYNIFCGQYFLKIIVNLPGVQRGWNCKRFCCLTNSYKQFDLFKFARAYHPNTIKNNNSFQDELSSFSNSNNHDNISIK